MYPPRPVPDPTGSEAASNDHASCGKRAAAAWIRALGGDPSGLQIPDGATAEQIAAGVNALGQGFHATVQYGDPIGVAIEWLVNGRGVVVGVNCTPAAEPTTVVTDIRHWLDLYDTHGECFNDWLQTFPTYPNLAACHDPDMGNVLIWRDGATQVSNTQSTGGVAVSTKPTTTEEDLMLEAIFKTPLDAQRWFVRLHYRLGLIREVESQASMDAHVAYLAANGADAFLGALEDSAEGKQDIAAERKADGLPPA